MFVYVTKSPYCADFVNEYMICNKFKEKKNMFIENKAQFEDIKEEAYNVWRRL